MTITYHKQFASQYEFRFFGDSVPQQAIDLSLTGLFENSIMQSVRLVTKADRGNKHNKGIKLQASRDMAANLIRSARGSK